MTPPTPPPMTKILDMPQMFGTTLEASHTQAFSGALALRIHGGDYHGRTVRIRAAQCTIGSASDCTLRLTAPGVRPLQCIILCGETGASVRRWSPDTQLNGRTFSEAPLMAGDRLAIGPIVLEVIEQLESPRRDRRLSDVAPAPVSQQGRAGELAGEIMQHLRRERGPNEAQQRLEKKKRIKSRQHIKRLEAELERLQAATAQLMEPMASTELAAPAPAPTDNQAAELREQLAFKQQEFEEACRQSEGLKAELSEASAALVETRAALTTQAYALESARDDYQRQADELLVRCTALEGQLTAASEKLAAAEAERATLRQQLEQVADSSVVSNASGQRMAELEQELSLQTERLATAQAAAAELRSSSQGSSEEWSQREEELSQRIASLEKLAATLEDELRAVAANPDKVELAEEQRHALEQQLSNAQRHWNEQRRELEAQALSAHELVQELENQISSMREALHSTHGQVRERDQLLSQLRDEIRAQMAIWSTEREQLLQQVAAAAENNSERANVAPSVRHDIEAYRDHPTTDRYADRELLAGGHALSEQPEVESENAIGETPQNSASDVLARLGAAGIWRDQAPAVAEPVQETQPASSFTATQSVPQSSAPAAASTSGPDEEESIEAYMSRLMKRVRGDAVANAFTVQQTAAEPVVEFTPEQPTIAVPVASVELAAPLLSPEEFLPRKSAPEQSSDLAAMRELAVNSARQAISRSSQQRFKKKSVGTTLGACAFVGLSVALFGWGFDTGNLLAWIGSGVSLAAGIFLLLRRMRMNGKRAAAAPAKSA